jgi:hypothetical protein
MAKRKAARAGRAAGARTSAGRSRAGATAKKSAPGGAAKTSRKSAAKRTAASASRAKRVKTRATARKAATATRKPPARKQTTRKQTSNIKKTASGAKKTVRRATVRTATPRSAPSAAKSAPLRRSPALDRARRIVTEDEDIVQTPPSSLDLDRSASAVRTGRRSLKDRFDAHTETSPALTAGDVDADWESAYSVGDEAPGGDNPTPDQDIVDDIGKAVGIEYQDNEELKGADKVEKRDKKRWELDPASSEDWEDR